MGTMADWTLPCPASTLSGLLQATRRTISCHSWTTCFCPSAACNSPASSPNPALYFLDKTFKAGLQSAPSQPYNLLRIVSVTEGKEVTFTLCTWSLHAPIGAWEHHVMLTYCALKYR